MRDPRIRHKVDGLRKSVNTIKETKRCSKINACLRLRGI
jgi:hypothetical protein